MTERFSGSAYGVPAAFDVAPEVAIEFSTLLPPGWTAGPVPEDTPCWWVESPVHAAAQVNAAELYIAEHAADLVFVHAGAVAFDGTAIVLPGRSFSGKSTLTEALVRAGGTYFSDEFALLRADGTVLPYPRPLALRAADGSAGRRIPVESLASVGDGPAQVGLVAELRYDRDALWSVESPGPAAATLGLIDNAVAAQSRPDEVLAAAAAVARAAHFVRGLRGDADDAAPRLIALLEQA
jgi:hypothetical protein